MSDGIEATTKRAGPETDENFSGETRYKCPIQVSYPKQQVVIHGIL